MHIRIKNFAKINEADIELNGITVIAGENNTGKSTIGKIVFSLFNSMNNLDERIVLQQLHSIERLCHYKFMGEFVEVCEFDSNPRIEARRFAEKVRNSIQESLEMSTENLTENEIEMILLAALQERSFRVVMEHRYNEIVKSLTKEINQRLTLESEKIVSELVDRAFSTVFGNQMNSLCKNSGAEAEIEYTIKNKTNHMLFQNNGCCELVNSIAFLNKAIYIDDPFIVDELSEGIYREFGTGNILKELLLQKRQDDEQVIESVLTREKIDIVFDKLQNIVLGDIERTSGRNFYLDDQNYSEPIRFNNLSTGLKSFVIIKMLLENGSISPRDVLILDEPEIHLHPQWQIAYAELIVLVQKYFDLTVIITTHSPYFLDAVDLYSRKYGISDKTNFYIASVNENNSVEIQDVREDINLIYQKMATPIQILETLRYEMNNN